MVEHPLSSHWGSLLSTVVVSLAGEFGLTYYRQLKNGSNVRTTSKLSIV